MAGKNGQHFTDNIFSCIALKGKIVFLTQISLKLPKLTSTC